MNRRLIILVFCLAGCDISGLVLPLGSPATPAPAAARTSSNDISSYKTLVRTVARVAGAREIALLKPLVTRRLSSSLDEVIANNADRFWKHLEVLRRGIEGGFSIPSTFPREDGRVEVPLRFDNGGTAQLIVREEDGQPRVDRF